MVARAGLWSGGREGGCWCSVHASSVFSPGPQRVDGAAHPIVPFWLISLETASQTQQDVRLLGDPNQVESRRKINTTIIVHIYQNTLIKNDENTFGDRMNSDVV